MRALTVYSSFDFYLDSNMRRLWLRSTASPASNRHKEDFDSCSCCWTDLSNSQVQWANVGVQRCVYTMQHFNSACNSNSNGTLTNSPGRFWKTLVMFGSEWTIVASMTSNLNLNSHNELISIADNWEDYLINGNGDLTMGMHKAKWLKTGTAD